MSKATISDQGHPEVILRTSFNQAFVDELTTIIPSRSRRWSKAGRRWFIKRECLPRLEAIARRHFDTVHVHQPVTAATRSAP